MRRCARVAVLGLLAAGCARTGPVQLDRYVLAAGPIILRDIPGNASGIAYSPRTKTLFVVVNDPPKVFELGLDGRVRRSIVLDGFDDTEGIAWVEGHTFAIAEEGRNLVCLVRIDPAAESVHWDAAARIIVDDEPSGNRGLEGVAYDAGGRRFFCVKESDPRRVYEFARQAAAGGGRPVRFPWDAERDELGLRDLSGLYYDAVSGHLLIVSDESQQLVECTTGGREVSRLDLSGGSAGLRDSVPQAEGVAMDGRGRLYVISEPNLLYVFRKR